MSTIRVFLVDDNAYFVSGASEWLNADAGIELVGTAATGGDALEQVERLSPDVVLIDESLPDMRVIDVIRRLRSLKAAPRIVLLTFHNGETARHAKTATGADGVVAKSRITHRLLSVIRELRPRSQRVPTRTKQSEITRSES